MFSTLNFIKKSFHKVQTMQCNFRDNQVLIYQKDLNALQLNLPDIK